MVFIVIPRGPRCRGEGKAVGQVNVAARFAHGWPLPLSRPVRFLQLQGSLRPPRPAALLGLCARLDEASIYFQFP